MRRADDELDHEPAPVLDDEDQALIAKLRALPLDGDEPDWRKLEASIRAEVGDRAPAPWWRNWRWIVPIWALATTATVALIVSRGHEAPTHHAVSTNVPPDARVTHDEPTPPPIANEPAPTVWLDGEPVELDEVDDSVLEALGEPASPSPDDQTRADMLPVTDFGWIDQLDDGAMSGVERWLAERKRS